MSMMSCLFHPDPSQNAIVYLTRSSEGSLKQLEASLGLLARNLLPWSQADVIIFHEDDLDPSVLDGHTAGIPVRFAQVDFSAFPEEMKDLPKGKRGYRHMCHFFANDIFLRPELEKYQYVLRLDVDSSILSPLKFNVFDEMRTRGYRYGYRAILKDKRCFSKDLWPTAKAYFLKSESAVRPFSQIPEPCVYYTNFEIYEMAWFRGEAWQSFFKAVDQAKGIWKYRWGDHAIRFIGVKALLPEEKIWCAKQIHYFHQSEWRAGFEHRLPHDLFKYYWRLSRWLLKEKVKSFTT